MAPCLFLILLMETVNAISSSSFPKSSGILNPNMKKMEDEKSKNNKRQEKEQLFEAYNLLHSLAQVIYSNIRNNLLN